MCRTLSMAIVIALFFASVTKAEEATKEETLKAWEFFLGNWKTSEPDGSSIEWSCEKTKYGTLLFHSDQFSLLVGWDASDNTCKSVGLKVDGRESVTWKLVGEEPRFEGITTDGVKHSIQCTGKDRYLLTVGDAKVVGQRLP